LHDHGYLDFRLVITACERRQAICIAVLLFGTVIIRQRRILIRAHIVLPRVLLPFIFYVIIGLVGGCCCCNNTRKKKFNPNLFLLRFFFPIEAKRLGLTVMLIFFGVPVFFCVAV
jgi:hypothetical protein